MLGRIASSRSSALLQELSTSVVGTHRTPTSDKNALLQYAARVWAMIKTWLGLHDVHPTDWGGMVSVKEWWRSNT